ncbi:MAG: M23 family metallopeptidase [Persicimonas sp.]
MTHASRPSLSLSEVFGLSPLPKRLAEAAMMLKGDEHTPPSRFGLSSLKILRPRLSLLTWLGWTPSDGRAPLYNLFNHTQTPPEEGWSVRKTQVRDYRGGQCTYDSHNGTDFAVPVGTVVVSAAPGIVVRVCNEFHRGGLKVIIDHGSGVMTTSNHLSRALVEVGERVDRGEPVALSGASGVDMVAVFPWSAPHIHYNVWLDGRAVDPFGCDGETPLWRDGNEPRPAAQDKAAREDEAFEPTAWDEAAVDEAIAGCRDAALRRRLEQTEPLMRRAADTLFHLNYFPTRFESRPFIFARRHERRPLLDLPLRPEDYVGVRYLDE